MKLKSESSPAVVDHPPERATRHKTRNNRFRLHCAECGELYYVDSAAFRQATSALEGDVSEIRFCCDQCEQERAEEEYAHSM
jgi:hypothetical protein